MLGYERMAVAARLEAYLLPVRPRTSDEINAFETAVEYQYEYETAQNAESVPDNIASYSIGNYSVSFTDRRPAAYTRDNLSPAAWAILKNAGLIRYSLPTARRL